MQNNTLEPVEVLEAMNAVQAGETFRQYVARMVKRSGHKRAVRREVERAMLSRCRSAGIPIDASAEVALQSMGRKGITS